MARKSTKGVTSVESAESQIELTPAEVNAVLAARKQFSGAPLAAPATDAQAQQTLAEALIKAINATRPVEKKTVFTRKKGNPWMPTDGSPKLKLKRIYLQHGLEIDADKLFNEEIELLNQVRPGSYCNGWIKVIKRKDGAIDIDYPVSTASQRMKLSSEFGINDFKALCARLIAEFKEPKQFKREDEDDF